MYDVTREPVWVWVRWYFTQGILTIVTAPLFLFLVYCVAVSGFGAALQGLALFRAMRAVFGFFGVVLVLTVGWLPVLLPPVLYYSLARNLPHLWLRPDASVKLKVVVSAAILTLMPLGAYLVFHSVAGAISWVADRDPCAAFAAGVTGSKPPVNCQ